MNDNDIKKCIKNGYHWCSALNTIAKIRNGISGHWKHARVCHATRAAAQAAIDERNRKILRDTMIKERIQQRYDDGGRVELKHLEDFRKGMVVQVNWHNPNGIQPFTIKGNNKDCFENIVKNGWAFYSLKGAEVAAAEENRVERIKWCLEHQHSPITEKQSEDLRGEKYYVIGKRGEVSPTTTIDISAIREGRAFWHGKDANAQKQENVISSSAQAAIDERNEKQRKSRVANLLKYRALAKLKACVDLIDADDDVYEFDGHRNEYFGKVHSVCPQMVGVPRETCGKDIRSTKNRLRRSKQKSVESHETPVGETQPKEVVTDEPQDPEPVKWATHLVGELVLKGDEVIYTGCGWRPATYEVGLAACRDGYTGPYATRYITPEWKAWKERQDAKTKTETPKPTTVRGWLETIPDPAIRAAAIRIAGVNCCPTGGRVQTSLSQVIIDNINWDKSPEGPVFWKECYRSALFGEPWPSYPPKEKQIKDGWTDEEIEKAAFKPREWTDIPQHIVSRNPGSKYHRTIHGVSEGTATVDVYNVLEAFGVTCPACQHAIKKLLCPGLRGKGSRLQDLTEAATSIARAIELEKQRGEGA